MVVLAPSLKKVIDGSLLQTMSTCVDATFLRRVLSADISDERLFDKDADRLPQMPIEVIERVGASVLLSTIENATLARILARRFHCQAQLIDAQRATVLVAQTEKLRESTAVAA